eukprot:TRINITY_DN1587_c0_g1_i1.p2 TRINITY_DN1587_c0_g1~~TRINITY_DN1587_c0_g1_i1.p2  ORF type:complete len:139 (+),score=16.64 TRINITY_DN1587_c0_g1_i1:70-486(+)
MDHSADGEEGPYIVVPVSNQAFDDVHIPIKSLPGLDIMELYDVLKVCEAGDSNLWCVVDIAACFMCAARISKHEVALKSRAVKLLVPLVESSMKTPAAAAVAAAPVVTPALDSQLKQCPNMTDPHLGHDASSSNSNHD